MLLVMSQASAENLVVNGGFEGWGGWIAQGSAHEWNRWRSHEPGTYTGALLGEWATRGRNGSLHQSGIPVSSGHRYLFRAWVWLDHGWSPGSQVAKISYLDAEDREIDGLAIPIRAPVKSWCPVKIVVIPPPGATSATIEFHASNISYYGSMAIDDVYLGAAK